MTVPEKVIEALSGGPLDAYAISEITGVPVSGVHTSLYRLQAEARVKLTGEKIKRNRYAGCKLWALTAFVHQPRHPDCIALFGPAFTNKEPS
jgi:DNA-binding IclR family transcriptional regulator